MLKIVLSSECMNYQTRACSVTTCGLKPLRRRIRNRRWNSRRKGLRLCEQEASNTGAFQRWTGQPRERVSSLLWAGATWSPPWDSVEGMLETEDGAALRDHVLKGKEEMARADVALVSSSQLTRELSECELISSSLSSALHTWYLCIPIWLPVHSADVCPPEPGLTLTLNVGPDDRAVSFPKSWWRQFGNISDVALVMVKYTILKISYCMHKNTTLNHGVLFCF